MLRVAVCDDTFYDLERICMLVMQFQAERAELDLKISRFSSAYELLESKDVRDGFDIYLLDILMPGINGIDAGRQIRSANRDCMIIYLTSTQDFALESYSVFAFQYLIKPITRDELFHVLDEAVARLGSNLAQSIAVKTKEGIVGLLYHNIVYVEYISHVLYYHQTDQSVRASLHIRTAFEDAVAPLLRDERFLHPHKSYIVNMNHIRRMTTMEFIMQDGAVIPIVRKNYKVIKDQYLDFLSEMGRGGRILEHGQEERNRELG